jgi:hypothetical protein
MRKPSDGKAPTLERNGKDKRCGKQRSEARCKRERLLYMNDKRQQKNEDPNHRATTDDEKKPALLLGRELGDGLGTLRDGVLGELSGEDEADGGLNLAGRDGRLLVVGRELRGLGRDALEDVVDERVEDEHGLVGDTSVGVDLLEDLFLTKEEKGQLPPRRRQVKGETAHLVDVGRVGLLAGLALALLVTVSGGGLLDSLLSGRLASGGLGGGSLTGSGSGLLLLVEKTRQQDAQNGGRKERARRTSAVVDLGAMLRSEGWCEVGG